MPQNCKALPLNSVTLRTALLCRAKLIENIKRFKGQIPLRWPGKLEEALAAVKAPVGARAHPRAPDTAKLVIFLTERWSRGPISCPCPFFLIAIML